jgi:hypothetical protein
MQRTEVGGQKPDWPRKTREDARMATTDHTENTDGINPAFPFFDITVV